MKQSEIASHDNNKRSFETEISELLQEQILFTESVYARLPMGVEIYDANGVLRSINDHALRMYGIDDRNTVVGTLNLFQSPYCDESLKAKIQAGEDVALEFEYDFDRINASAYFQTRNRHSMIYEVRMVPIRNKPGTIVGHMLLANDVTAAKETEYRNEESRKNLEMAMEAANISSWTYDVEKKLFGPLYGNTIVQETMSMEALQRILHPQDRAPLERMVEQIINKEIEQGQIDVRFYNEEQKQYRHYESRMRLSLEHLGKLLIVGTELDVTDRIHMAKKAQDLIEKRELTMHVSGIIHWDYDLHTNVFESYNDPVNEYSGETRVSIPQFMEVLHPEDYSVFNDFIQSMKSGHDETINFTCRIRFANNEAWQHCNIIGIPFERDEEGRIVRYTGFRQDISKLHQLNKDLQERNYKLELAFKSIGMTYWDFDVASKQFKAFNDSVNDFDPERAITPEDYLNTAHPDDRDSIREKIQGMIQGTDADFNFQYRSKTKWDKEWKTMLINGMPSERDKKGHVIRYTGITFNNTKWEKIAQELKDLKEKAELSDRLKSAFLANMSHEIRTPLNAIVGFSELMVNSEDQVEKDEYMGIIQSNNELLLRLINDILDLSKIESGILERKREKFNLAQVCNELHTMIQPKITSPNVEFQLDSPGSDCWVFLDRNRLKQVWMNFLTNAVKCTLSGTIKMGYSIEREGIRIYVEDSGVGIPPELHERIFGRFQKLNEFAQGTGLGLAISRAIVEAAGGEVGFTSAPGTGSTFWAWIPCEINIRENTDLSPQPSKQQPMNKTEDKQLKILVAEDNDSNYLLVQHILKEYALDRVDNGVDAVKKVREENFDLVLMDMKMPIMGGLEATRKIREFNTQIPIIALTANAFDSDRTNALDAGCNAFLTKPLKKNLLLDALSMKW